VSLSIALEHFMNVTDGTNTKSIFLMLLSMATFALADTLIKMSGSFLSPAQIMFFLMSGGLILFAIIAVIQGENLIEPRAFTPVLLLRYCAEVIGLVGLVMALTHVPLSTVGAVTQASPILVAVGAVLFLKEAVSWRRWSSIAMGFLGVMLVIQPGAESLDYAVLWAVLALVAFSVRDLVTRLTPPDIASASLATYTMVVALPFAIAWVLFNGESFFPAKVNWVIVTFMVVLGSLGYLLLISSLRIGELSAVMPFRYSRIVFLLVLGVLVFGERPSVSMIIGATLIIVSGVYIMWRERILKQRLDQKKFDV
jgi:drug/metabolite transporter (DMT)-like permease